MTKKHQLMAYLKTIFAFLIGTIVTNKKPPHLGELKSLIIYIKLNAHEVLVKRKMLIKNIAYMEKELSEMKKTLAMMDAKEKLLEPMREWALESKFSEVNKDNNR